MASALSSDTDRAAASAAELGLAVDRPYASCEQMAVAEAAREDLDCPIKLSMLVVKMCH